MRQYNFDEDLNQVMESLFKIAKNAVLLDDRIIKYISLFLLSKARLPSPLFNGLIPDTHFVLFLTYCQKALGLFLQSCEILRSYSLFARLISRLHLLRCSMILAAVPVHLSGCSKTVREKRGHRSGLLYL